MHRERGEEQAASRFQRIVREEGAEVLTKRICDHISG
jgi:hypothetical protein